MSQPTGMFSVRRPRETLGPIQNHSGIPMPQSAMKRTSSSQDMRQLPYTSQHARSTSINGMQRPAQPNFSRASIGGNLADPMSAVRRSNSTAQLGGSAAHRQSLAPNQMFGASQTPAATSVQRRSSIYSRPSAGLGQAATGFFSQQISAIAKRADPRAGLGKAHRERMSQELYDYLTQNNFELDMKHSLRPTATTSPTQNDFNLMFQWLYKRIDPSYKFQKSMDIELPQLIKQLRYPYGTDFTKSHITTIIPQHWPKFLLLFHWLMQLAQMLENFQRGAYDDACLESGVDVQPDRIVFKFLFSAYQDWLQVSPDQDDAAADQALQPHRDLMTQEFSEINSRHEDELKAYEDEHAQLSAQIEELERSMPDVAKLDKTAKIIEDDIKKFEDYNSSVKAKIEKYESRQKLLDEDIAKIEADLGERERDRLELQQAVDSLGISINDIDRMNAERDRLTKSNDDALASLEQAQTQVAEREADTIRRLDELESITKRYNTLSYQMSLIPSTAINAAGKDFELQLHLSQPTNFSSSRTSRRTGSPTPDSDRLLASAQTGYTPTQLLSIDLRGTIRTHLVQLRKDITTRRQTAHQNANENRDLIESMNDALHDKSTEIATLSYKLQTIKSEYSSLKDEHNTAWMEMTSKREKTEKELMKLRQGVERGVMELQAREVECQVAWEVMRDEGSKVREGLRRGVEGLLEDVVRFKLHVKEGLEGFEEWVEGECKDELVEAEKLGFLGEISQEQGEGDEGRVYDDGYRGSKDEDVFD